MGTPGGARSNNSWQARAAAYYGASDAERERMRQASGPSLGFFGQTPAARSQLAHQEQMRRMRAVAHARVPEESTQPPADSKTRRERVSAKRPARETVDLTAEESDPDETENEEGLAKRRMKKRRLGGDGTSFRKPE